MMCAVKGGALYDVLCMMCSVKVGILNDVLCKWWCSVLCAL